MLTNKELVKLSGLAGVALESCLMSARSSAVAYPEPSMDLGNGPIMMLGADTHGQKSGNDPLAQAPFTEGGTPKASNRRPVTWEQQLVGRPLRVLCMYIPCFVQNLFCYATFPFNFFI